MTFKQALLHSSVLRPYLQMGNNGANVRPERLIARGSLRTSAADVASMIFRGADTIPADVLFRSAFQKAVELNSEALALVGEVFIETPHRSYWASERDINEYFFIIRKENSIVGEYSAACFLLSEFLNGRRGDGEKCLKAFFNCMKAGHLVSGASYSYWEVIVRKKLSRNRVLRAGALVSVLWNLFHSWAELVFSHSEQKRRACYLWRYGDLERFAPRKTKKIDSELSLGRFQWNPEDTPSIRGMKIEGEPVYLGLSGEGD